MIDDRIVHKAEETIAVRIIRGGLRHPVVLGHRLRQDHVEAKIREF